MIMGQFDWARPFVILVHLAHAQVSLEEAMDWAKQRHAFRRPISKYEGVSFMIAENYTMVEAARMMCYKALWLRDQGLPHAKEAAMSKWFGNEAAVRAIHDSMIILGHVGYSDEHPVQERLRYAMGHEIGGGTSHIQKLIIARELMGREGLPY
jgi:cyclohexanecarboxyl-CoA dehydrogenase